MGSKSPISASRNRKLGLLYIERSHHLSKIKFHGLARGWPSQDWNGNAGQPLFYAFMFRYDTESKASELHLNIYKVNGSVQVLEASFRKDLRRSIDAHCREFIIRGLSRLNEIPLAQDFIKIERLAFKFFAPINLNPPDFEEVWKHDWEAQKSQALRA